MAQTFAFHPVSQLGPCQAANACCIEPLQTSGGQAAEQSQRAHLCFRPYMLVQTAIRMGNGPHDGHAHLCFDLKIDN